MTDSRCSATDASPIPPTLWDPLAAWPAGQWWLWAGLTVVAVLSQGPEFIQSLRPGPREGVDFFQEWSSARSFFQGGPLYGDLPELAERYLGVDVDRTRAHIPVATRTPTAMLLTMPLALLDYPDACLAWNLMSLAAFGASIWLVMRGLRIPFSRAAWFPLVTLLLLCNPLRQQTNQGQLSGLLSLLVTSIWFSARAGRPVWSGVWLGTATALKLFPGFLLIYFALRRQWWTVAAGMISFVALNGVTAALLGSSAYATYIGEVLPSVAATRATWPNASLAGFVCKLFDDPAPVLFRWHWRVVPLWSAPTVARIGCLLCVAVVTLFTARAIHSARTRGESDRAFGVAVTAMLLVSPVTWDHYFLMLVLPLALVWLWLPPQSSCRPLFLFTLAGLWLNALTVGQAFVPAGDPPRDVFPIHVVTLMSFQCYALVSLFALGLATTKASQSEPTEPRIEPDGKQAPRAE